MGMVLGQVPTSAESGFPKELVWKGSGGCVVEFANTPCRTVRYHWSSFAWSEGWTVSQYIEAFERDGSRSTTVIATRRPPWLFPRQTWHRGELVLRKENRTTYIDHERKTYETHLRANGNRFYWEEDDTQCSHAGSRWHSSQRIGDSVIAGVHVVGYRGLDDTGAYHEDYFAPSIGCQPMRSHSVTRGVLGWKTSEYDMTVDSYQIGRPASILFDVPAGYTQVASILHR